MRYTINLTYYICIKYVGGYDDAMYADQSISAGGSFLLSLRSVYVLIKLTMRCARLWGQCLVIQKYF